MPVAIVVMVPPLVSGMKCPFTSASFVTVSMLEPDDINDRFFAVLGGPASGVPVLHLERAEVPGDCGSPNLSVKLSYATENVRRFWRSVALRVRNVSSCPAAVSW